MLVIIMKMTINNHVGDHYVDDVHGDDDADDDDDQEKEKGIGKIGRSWFESVKRCIKREQNNWSLATMIILMMKITIKLMKTKMIVHSVMKKGKNGRLRTILTILFILRCEQGLIFMDPGLRELTKVEVFRTSNHRFSWNFEPHLN